MDILKNLNDILDRCQKRNFILLLCLMIIGAILETICVALIFLFVSLVIKPSAIFANPRFQFLFKSLNIESNNQFLIFVGVILILIYTFKNAFLFFQFWAQYNFVYNNQMRMSLKLMRSFMNKPYEYYLTSNTSDVIASVTTDIFNMFQVIGSLLSLLAEFFTALVLITYLLYVDVRMTLFISVMLVVIVLLLKKKLEPYLKSIGISNQKNNSLMIRWVNQGIRGIQQIKIIKKEDYVANQYGKAGFNYTDTQKKYNMCSSSPRLLIEAIFMVALLLYIITIILLGYNLADIVPQISALAMAFTRLLPCANRINTNIHLILFRSSSLNLVKKHLESNWKIKEYVAATPSSKTYRIANEIKFQDVSYAYPASSTNILEHVDMTIPVGQSTAIVGKSGSGKTTVVNLLVGLLPLSSGSILLDGITLDGTHLTDLISIGYVPQKIFLIDGTIAENIALGEEKIDFEQIQNVLIDSQLADFVQTLPLGIHTHIGDGGIRLSGGQQQRLGIAQALYRNPALLILDEATSALDAETEAAIMNSIHSLHNKKIITIVIITHQWTTLEYCDCVYEVSDKKIHCQKKPVKIFHLCNRG